MKIGDFRRLHPSRLPTKAPIGNTLLACIIVKIYSIEDFWLYSTVAYIAILWVVWFSQFMTERWVDPFDLER